MVEQAAVNRKVGGSSPLSGAIFLDRCAGVAELADAQDLKSCDPYRSYRFDPGFRHHKDLANVRSFFIPCYFT